MFLDTCKKKTFKDLGNVIEVGDGLKLERLLESRSGFLSKGVTRADLKQDGKHPSAKDRLAKCAIRWEKTSEQETISGVGMKFIGDDLGTMFLRRLKTSK